MNTLRLLSLGGLILALQILPASAEQPVAGTTAPPSVTSDGTPVKQVYVPVPYWYNHWIYGYMAPYQQNWYDAQNERYGTRGYAVNPDDPNAAYGAGRNRAFPAMPYRDFEKSPAFQQRVPLEGQGVAADRAVIEVNVPDAKAVLKVNGQVMTQEGTKRIFLTPVLTPGKTYYFEIRAEWGPADDRYIKSTPRFEVTPGKRHTLTFQP